MKWKDRFRRSERSAASPGSPSSRPRISGNEAQQTALPWRRPTLEAVLRFGGYEWWPAEVRLTCSSMLLDLYALSRTPRTSECVLPFARPQDRTRGEAHASAFQESAALYFSHSFCIVHSHNSDCFFLNRGLVERDQDGSVRILRVPSCDVTDPGHSRAEDVQAALRQSEMGCRAVVKATRALIRTYTPAGLRVVRQAAELAFTGQATRRYWTKDAPNQCILKTSRWLHRNGYELCRVARSIQANAAWAATTAGGDG